MRRGWPPRKAAFFFLLWASAALAQPAPEPAALLEQARPLLEQPATRPQAQALLERAVGIWDQHPAAAPLDYSEALLWLGMLRYPAVENDKTALAQQVEPLLKKAVAIREASPETPRLDLALALETQALVLDRLGRKDEALDPRDRARRIRDQRIETMQPPSDPDMLPFHIGPGISRPAILSMVPPEPTLAARLLGLHPEVVAGTVIGANGQISEIEVLQPAGFGLDEKAVECLLQWRFLPARKDGVPVPVEAEIPLQFP